MILSNSRIASSRFSRWALLRAFFFIGLLSPATALALSLEITSSANPVEDGTALTFTLTVANPSQVALTNVVLQAVTPDFMRFDNVETSPASSGCPFGDCSAGETVTWTLGNLGAGEVQVVRFSSNVSTTADDGVLVTADATVTADGVLGAQASHSVVVTEGPNQGRFLLWPVPTYRFAQPTQDYADFNDASANRHHSGIDIGAPIGTPVIAAAAGTTRVILLENEDNKTHCLGNVVIIDHGAKATLYGHLDSVSIGSGSVIAGQPIGTVGNTVGDFQDGSPCAAIGSNLHFEVKNNPVLGTSTDDGTTWGFTPSTPGLPIPGDQPDAFGYYDPVISIESGITQSAISTFEVSGFGAGAILRAGPDTRYRAIGNVGSGQQFNAIRERAVATSNCSGGWLQITNTNGSYFIDSDDGSIPDAWICRGNEQEDWLAQDDGDGVDVATDNCPALANADQLDFDGDGLGDACDSDDDGDGLTDFEEATVFGTDPLDTDSDDDNVPDRHDVEGFQPIPEAPPTQFVPPVVSPLDGTGLRIFDGQNFGDFSTPVTKPYAPERVHVLVNGWNGLFNTGVDINEEWLQSMAAEIQAAEIQADYPHSIIVAYDWTALAGTTIDNPATRLACGEINLIFGLGLFDPIGCRELIMAEPDFWVPNASVDTHALLLERALSELGLTEEDDVMFYGHSLGGAIVAKASLIARAGRVKNSDQHIEVDRTVMFDPPENTTAYLAGGQVNLEETVASLSLDDSLVLENFWGSQGLQAFGKAYRGSGNVELIDYWHFGSLTAVMKWYEDSVADPGEVAGFNRPIPPSADRPHPIDTKYRSGNKSPLNPFANRFDYFGSQDNLPPEPASTVKLNISDYAPTSIDESALNNAYVLTNGVDFVLGTGSPVYVSFDYPVGPASDAIRFEFEPLSWQEEDFVTVEINDELRYFRLAEFFDDGAFESAWLPIEHESGNNITIRIGYHSDSPGQELRILGFEVRQFDDTDGDGAANDEDAFPNDPLEIFDTDKDGIGDEADLDDDGDGLDDQSEQHIGSSTRAPDTDGDGFLDLDEVNAGSNPISESSTPETVITITGTLNLQAGINAVGTIANTYTTLLAADLIGLMGGQPIIESVVTAGVDGELQKCGYISGILTGSGCNVRNLPGRGWFVQALNEHSTNVDFGVECPNFELLAGPNLISFPCVNGTTTAFSLLETYAGTNGLVTIEALDQDESVWQSASLDQSGNAVGDDFVLDQFEAYLLHTTLESTIIVRD